ncbi:unnamed protein product [Musa hybrid cultivar]
MRAAQSEQPRLGDPDEAQQVRTGGWITFPFILVSNLGLGLALSGATANLIVYLVEEYNVKSIDAAQIGNIVSGSTNLAPVVGAIVSDAFFGCYTVIVSSTIISLLAVVLLTLTAAVPSLRPPPCAFGSDACEAPSAGQMAFLFTAVALVAVGAGGSRFNILAMGGGQVDEVRDQDIFFNWYFIVLYVSAVVGSTVLVFVEDSVSWTLGYALCTVANAVAVVVLLLGTKYYRRPAAQGSPFTGMARVIVAAFKKWNVKVSQQNPSYYYGSGGDDDPNSCVPTQSLRFLNRAAWICHGNTRADGSIARPWSLCTVRQVEDLKAIVHVLPLWSASIFLSISIGIQLSLSVLQALTMDRSLGPHFSIPAGSMVVSSLAATTVSLFLLDRLLLPLWCRLAGGPSTPLQRIGLGQVINAAGMAASALVERRRAAVVHAHHAEGQPGWVVPMTALWLVLPLTVTGVGEALHFPSQVALYYQEFPRSLRSTATGMVALLVAVGFYLSTAVVSLVRRATGWLPDNINGSKMENVYWLLTALTMVNFVYYVTCAMLYKYRTSPKEADGDAANEGGH